MDTTLHLERTRSTARSADNWAINGRRSDPVDPLAASRNPSPSHRIFDPTSRDGARDTRPMSDDLDGRTIVFRTAAGTKLLELTIRHNVAFEVDGYTDTDTFSVVV